MPKRFPFAIASGFALLCAVPSSANPPVTQVQPKAQLILDPCLTKRANQTKNLPANEASVRIVQPNVTPTVIGGSPNPEPACNFYVGDFNIASNSHPPAGFTEAFTVSGTYDAGSVVYQSDCASLKAEVKIYKKSGNGFSWVGGGRLNATFHAATTTAPITPAACVFSEAAGYKAVSGKVPSEGTETYRVMTGGGMGSGIATLARRAK